MDKEIEDLKYRVKRLLRIGARGMFVDPQVLAAALEIEGCCEHCGKLLKESDYPGHYYQCDCRE